MKKIIYCLVFLSILGCKDNASKKVAQLEELSQDAFELSGTYRWAFKLMGTDQLSTHTFYKDRIEYVMEGIIYSTEYSMNLLSFDKEIGKWIGQDEEDNFYVLFFKNFNENEMTLYKHKCKNGGLQEAINFKLPSSDDTDNHGWNVYSTNSEVLYDSLELIGDYLSEDHVIKFEENQITFNNTTYEQLSYHQGERRWVGKNKYEYLQIFINSLANQKSIEISAERFSDYITAYKTKHNSVKWTTYEKQ